MIMCSGFTFMPHGWEEVVKPHVCRIKRTMPSERDRTSPFFKTNHKEKILSPIEITVQEVPMSAFGATSEFVEVSELVRVDTESAADGSQQGGGDCESA